VSRHKLTAKSESSEIMSEVANRLYDIRCRIVHAKQPDSDVAVEPILPYSRDEALLVHDIELIRFVANTVIHASSDTLDF
jgi:hypothetical protein